VGDGFPPNWDRERYFTAIPGRKVRERAKGKVMGTFRQSCTVVFDNQSVTVACIEEAARLGVVAEAISSGYTPSGTAYAVWAKGSRIYGEVEVAERTDGR
jgi:hypothetical protein